jgi:hypothetical protein
MRTSRAFVLKISVRQSGYGLDQAIIDIVEQRIKLDMFTEELRTKPPEERSWRIDENGQLVRREEHI